MTKKTAHKTTNLLIAAVWLANGLFAKVLHLVPRHQEIVAKILGAEFAKPLTIIIGISEIVMAIWIVSGYKSRINAMLQIAIVLLMNCLEFMLAPELLLWGRMNLLFAILFACVVYYNEFVLRKTIHQHH